MADAMFNTTVGEGIRHGVTGAKTGAKYGGGWGAAIGGIIGTVVGVGFGYAEGRKAKKYSKYMKAAQQIQAEREQNATEATFLQMIRQARVARSVSQASSAYAGISTSSLATSALSSIGSQGMYNVQYLANDRRLFDLYSSYMRKAGKAAEQYKTLQAYSDMSLYIAKAAGSFGGSGSEWKPGTKTTTPATASAGPTELVSQDILGESVGSASDFSDIGPAMGSVY